MFRYHFIIHFSAELNEIYCASLLNVQYSSNVCKILLSLPPAIWAVHQLSVHSLGGGIQNAGGMPSIFSQCHCRDVASYYGISCCNLTRYANNGSIR